MSVVFLTRFAPGHETRRISARVSCKNCRIRAKRPGVATVFLGRRSPSPPAVPAFVFVGGGDDGVSAVSSTTSDSMTSSSLTVIFPNAFATSFSRFNWQGYQDSNPDFRRSEEHTSEL